jgi:hypothetical protein
MPGGLVWSRPTTPGARLAALGVADGQAADVRIVIGDPEPAELAVAAAGEEREVDEVAEGRRASIQKAANLVLGQIANDGKVDRFERLDAARPNSSNAYGSVMLGLSRSVPDEFRELAEKNL